MKYSGLRGDTSYRSFPKVPIPCSPLFTLTPKPIKKTGEELWTNDRSDICKGVFKTRPQTMAIERKMDKQGQGKTAHQRRGCCHGFKGKGIQGFRIWSVYPCWTGDKAGAFVSLSLFILLGKVCCLRGKATAWPGGCFKEMVCPVMAGHRRHPCVRPHSLPCQSSNQDLLVISHASLARIITSLPESWL